MQSSVSVIIPCYCCADTVARAVDSVIAQTLLPEEIILVDDFSDDEGETLNALEQLRQVYPERNIRILRLGKNSGPGSARNAGWDVATQPYIAFLDADDSWHPRKLEVQCQWMASHPEVVLSGHASVKISVSDSLPDLAPDVTAFPVSASGLLLKNYFPTRSVMLKRELSFRFIEGKRYAEDLLLWLTIVLNGYHAWRLNQPMAYTYKEEFGEGGLTADLWKNQQGVIDTYQRLYRAGFIPFFYLIMVSGFSFLKYLRRWGMVKSRFLLSKVL